MRNNNGLQFSDFVDGFRYQMKERFGDGTVKTKEDYDNAKWVDCVFKSYERAYIYRMFFGANAASGLLGLRRMPVDTNRKKYFATYYQQNKGRMDARSVSWMAKNKKKKSEYNRQYREKVKRQNESIKRDSNASR